MADIQREGLRQRRLERDAAALTPRVHGENSFIGKCNIFFFFRFVLPLRQRIESSESFITVVNLGYVKPGKIEN
jgi:hypothetical protein